MPQSSTTSWVNHKVRTEPAWWRSWTRTQSSARTAYCKPAAGGFRDATGSTPGADGQRVTMTDRCWTPRRKRRAELTAHPALSCEEDDDNGWGHGAAAFWWKPWKQRRALPGWSTWWFGSRKPQTHWGPTGGGCPGAWRQEKNRWLKSTQLLSF